MKMKNLGAAHDNPRAIYARACELADSPSVYHLREASEMGWLAVSSMVDVVAASLGLQEPEGFNARLNTLKTLAKRARVSEKTLTEGFAAAHDVLHGECFHADMCTHTCYFLKVIVGPQLDSCEKALAKIKGRR